MSKNRWFFIQTGAFVAALLQILGIAELVNAASDINKIIIGAFLLVTGTILLTFTLEYCCRAKGRGALWAIASLLGPPGCVIMFLPSRCCPEKSVPMGTRKFTFTGIAMTLAVTAGIAWAAAELYNQRAPADRYAMDQLRANEIEIFNNLQKLIKAQQQYIQKD